MRFRLTVAIVVMASLLAIVGDDLTAGGAKKSAVAVGEKVPDFSITMLDGKSVKLSELRKDKKRSEKGVIVLAYWCSTCHSCRHIEAHLAKVAESYSGKAIVLALDANIGDTAPVISAMLKKANLTLPVAIDANGQAADIFGIDRTTTTLVIDGDGVLRYFGQFKQKDGGSAEDALKAVLTGTEVTVKSTPHKGCPIVRE